MHRGDFFTLTIGDDCVAWDYWPSVEPETYDGCTFLDTESMEITEIPLYCWPQIVDGLLVRKDYKITVTTVNISNPKFNCVSEICSGNGLIVCESYSRNRGTRIEVWKMGNPPTLLRTRTFEDRDWTIFKVDKRFIVANDFHHRAETFLFISTETLEEFTSLSAMNYKCYLYESDWGKREMDFRCLYAQGLLFQYRGNGIVRILDVATGTYVNNVHIPFQKKDKKFIKLLDTWVSSNSTVIVIGWKYSKNRHRRVSHLSVYDLEAVKKRNSDPGSHLLYTLQFKFDIHSFVMNESEIAFSGEGRSFPWRVTVLKFANFCFAEQKSSYLKENPEAHEDSNEEIVEMKMKKIINDLVDFDDEDCEKMKNNEIMEQIRKMKKKRIRRRR